MSEHLHDAAGAFLFGVIPFAAGGICSVALAVAVAGERPGHAAVMGLLVAPACFVMVWLLWGVARGALQRHRRDHS